LISSLAVTALMAGVMPASTVAAPRPIVSGRLVCHTSRMTRGSADHVPATARRSERHRPRRSRGPSGGASGMSGDPVRPLSLAWSDISRPKKRM